MRQTRLRIDVIYDAPQIVGLQHTATRFAVGRTGSSSQPMHGLLARPISPRLVDSHGMREKLELDVLHQCHIVGQCYFASRAGCAIG